MNNKKDRKEKRYGKKENKTKKIRAESVNTKESKPA